MSSDECQVEVSSNNTLTICPLTELARGEHARFRANNFLAAQAAMRMKL
jgi:hypothetical protein